MTVAVLIATCDRSRLLRERSLASVWAQTVAPSQIIVVDDGLEPLEPLESHRQNVAVTVLRNTGLKGASGAWNTGLRHLAMTCAADELYVAILDDDDAWHPTYLERCLQVSDRTAAYLICGGLRWLHGANDVVGTMQPPSVLKADDFLVGNPGIQGSNLFVLLSAMLAIGGFDEDLPSTTDRDLLVRLIDYGVSYQALNEPLVDHYAEMHRPRLSTAGSDVKRQGLERFWAKHRGRMSTQQQRLFWQRAGGMFGTSWSDASDAEAPPFQSS
jgi:glycosyltransferase involved in cell wall biosynthesis